jgi:hypothetical protein
MKRSNPADELTSVVGTTHVYHGSGGLWPVGKVPLKVWAGCVDSSLDRVLSFALVGL